MGAKSLFSKYEPEVYSLLRIFAGFLFLWHGSQKLFDLPPAQHVMPSYIVFIAGPIEFFGGLMVMLGLGTRLAAFICSGEMAYAYWTVHATKVLLPLLNGGELAIIYCFLFLFIAARGPGRFSIDHIIEKRRVK